MKCDADTSASVTHTPPLFLVVSVSVCPHKGRKNAGSLIFAGQSVVQQLEATSSGVLNSGLRLDGFEQV